MGRTKNIIVFIILLGSFLIAKANQILIPMDESQKNHLSNCVSKTLQGKFKS